MKLLDWVKEILGAPLEKMYLFMGFSAVILSFSELSYDKKIVFKLIPNPNWYFFITGTFLIIGAFIKKIHFSPILKEKNISIIENGIQIKVTKNQIINIIIDSIENVDSSKSHSAVILPANTCFDDECINDERSALGAYFEKNFPGKIDKIQKIIQSKVHELNQSSNVHEITEFEPGTTIYIAKPLSSDNDIIIVGVTKFSQGGIVADTESIISSVKAVFKESASRRISELAMPVIGTGHGGLDFQVALLLILLQSIHCMSKEGFHNLKKLTIFVYDPKGEKKQQMEMVAKSIMSIF